MPVILPQSKPAGRRLDGAGRDGIGRDGFGAGWGLLAVLGLMVCRALITDHAYGAYTGCHGCFHWAVLQHDAWLLAAELALLALAFATRRRWLQYLCMLPAVILLVLMALDVGIFASLNQRLYVADLLRFGGEGGAIGGFAAALLDSGNAWLWMVSALVVLTGIAGLLWPKTRRPRFAAALALAGVIALALGLLPATQVHYVHPESYQNLVELNLDHAVDQPYSASFRRSLAQQPAQLNPVCSKAESSDRPDVILVAVESLSAYHSALLGGPLNATPRLDALARANHYFSHFYANGFTTDGGRIALYTGRAPLPPPGLARTLPLPAYQFQHGTLPMLARRAGYTSHYFTSGNLGFLDSDIWLRRLGFDSIDGAEDPFYKGMKRWQFDAAADKALFDRALAWMDANPDKRPYVAALLTVSSHPPFVDPRTGRIDQTGTFRYVDEQLDRFYRELKLRGFFSHGVLLITGDHRSMTPLRPGEFSRWGERALARIPMVVVGDVRMPGRIDEAFQQSDFPASFAYLAGLRACADLEHGIFLRPQPQPPKFVLHASGATRNRVDIFFDHRNAAMLLDGDDSRWVGVKPPQWLQVARSIHALRIRETELARRYLKH